MYAKLIPTIIKSKRKTLTLTISPDSSVIIKAPLHASDRQIQSFFELHKAWIEDQLIKLQSLQKFPEKTYSTGEKFLFLGNELELVLGDYPHIVVSGSKLLFPSGLRFIAQRQLSIWYKKQARSIITAQVDNYATQMGTTYNGITYSDTSSQWGSCTHDNKLQFNWRLIMAPILVLNYVVVHELAHTFEKNHAASFWKIVNKYIPSYRRQRNWLKDHHNLLIV